MSRRLLTLALAAGVLFTAGTAVAAGPPPGIHGALRVTVLSSPPEDVSGGEARIRIDVPSSVPFTDVLVTLNGLPAAATFTPAAGHTLEGVLTSLPLGDSVVAVRVPGPGNSANDRSTLTLTNHPVSGPIFSGPHQTPFLCSSSGDRARFDLGPALDSDCAVATRVGLYYRSTTDGAFHAYNPAAPPADVQQIPSPTGSGTIPFVIRWERGTINRFIYTYAMLDPNGTGPSQLPYWNHKLIYYFGGGVGIGHYQGGINEGESRYVYGLSQGYAVAWSTGTKTDVHYNLQLGGETAIMTKSHFVVEYGAPIYTVGLGGSGGGIQQYVYGQNHPGLLDGAIPQYSYPDMVTQTIHVGDCELLERWMDDRVLHGDTTWADWTHRSWLEGLNASATVANPYAALEPWLPRPGSDECINGWRGLSPLALNPLFGTAPGVTPQQQLTTEWTHWGDLVNIYGTDEFGYGRRTWDNVGVQYGLQALRDHHITPAQFLDLNANVGGWKRSKDMVQEGCPFIGAPASCVPGNIDPWSSRNMTLSPDGGATPAARTEGSIEAMNAAYRSGIVFDGRIDIPIIDWRHYLEEQLNMHNSRQSFVERKRMLDYDGNASNQVIWFTDARPDRVFDQTPMALSVMDQWLMTGQRPAAAVDSCFATNGALIASGAGVWDGILDSKPAGACTQRFQIHDTSRTVAGGPFEGNVFKCALQPVRAALGRGLYGSWRPDPSQLERLEQIFPTGVCDYTKPDVGRPPGF
jgi:hypothetical protein